MERGVKSFAPIDFQNWSDSEEHEAGAANLIITKRKSSGWLGKGGGGVGARRGGEGRGQRKRESARGKRRKSEKAREIAGDRQRGRNEIKGVMALSERKPATYCAPRFPGFDAP